MAERDAEHADIVGPSVAGPDHGLGIDLIGETKTRRKMGKRRIDVPVQTDTVFAGDHHFAGSEILEPSVIFAVDILREVDLPAQADFIVSFGVICQVSCDIREQTILSFRGFGGVTDITRERFPSPSRNDAGPRPPPVGPSVVVGSNVISPDRCESLGTRRFCWKRTVHPEFDGMVSAIWVMLPTHWNSCSCSFRGQLQLLTPRAYPKLNPPVPSA